MASLVCVGVVVGVHGVKGAVRVKSFTERPADIGGYGPVEDETGKRFGLRVLGQAKGLVIAGLDGVADRDGALALKGVRLYVGRERLPKTEEDEFLIVDLVGLAAEAPDGTRLGTVKAVLDFGAGEVLEVDGPEGGLMVPFTRDAVPVVDVPGGKVVVIPPIFATLEEEEDQGGDR